MRTGSMRRIRTKSISSSAWSSERTRSRPPRSALFDRQRRHTRPAREEFAWSAKLHKDERILAALEKLMNKFNATSTTPVGKVVNKMPGIAIVTAAGLNQQMLGDVAKQARHFAASQRLAEKYDLPLPDKLQRILVDPLTSPTPAMGTSRRAPCNWHRKRLGTFASPAANDAPPDARPGTQASAARAA